MAKPLAVWDKEDPDHPNLVWWSRLDNRFQIEVHRAGHYTGELIIFDHNDGDKELFRKSVGLSYGAAFGPDVGDIADWQDRCTKFIDEELPK